jgi:histidine triad (HIT) family protein
MDGCIFCEIVRGEAPSWRVYEDEATYAFLNIFPASEYHTIVVPKVHHVDVFDTPVEELVTVSRAVKRVVDLYQRVLDISNVQIINSSGAQAQQDVFHIHFHIVPRQLGDGQDVEWSIHPEWRGRFDDMVSKLRDAGAAEAGARGNDADLADLLRGIPY